MPSIIPSCAGPAPSDARKAGRIQYAISLAVSLRNEVRPKTYTFRGVFWGTFPAIAWESGLGGASMSVHENSMGKKANGAGVRASNTFYIAFTSCIAVAQPSRVAPGSLITFYERH